MRLGGLLLALGLVSLAHAQDQPNEASSKWRVGASFTVGQSHRELQADGSSLFSPLIVQQRNSLEEPGTFLGGSLDILRDVGRRWSIGIGFQALQLGYRIGPVPHASFEDPEGRSGATAIVFYRYTHLSVPVMAHFRIGQGKLRFQPALGLAADALVDASSSAELTAVNGSTTTSRSSINTDQLNRLNLSGVVELNVLYHVGTRWQLRLAPTARHQLLWMNDQFILERLYAGGVALGVLFTL
jgi:hypothetical protein